MANMTEIETQIVPSDVKPKIIRLLKKIPLFAGLYDDEFIPLCEIYSGRVSEKGTYIFKEGDHSQSMFVLLSGQICISTKNKGDIYKVMPGEMFGEIGMITKNLRSATAQATSDCAVLEISNSDYKILLGKYPRISSIIMRRIAESLASHIVRINCNKSD